MPRPQIKFKYNQRNNYSQRHTILSLPETNGKEKIFKNNGEKRYNAFWEIQVKIKANFLSETMETRRQWSTIIQLLEKGQPTILYTS